MNTRSQTNSAPEFLLSGFGLGWPERVSEVGVHLEQLGYARYWVTEHHERGKSGSPIVAMSVVAARTARIAIGSAGIMIRYANPLQVASDALLLDLLYPQRIDLGTIGGTAGAAGAPLDRALSAGCERDDWRDAYAALLRYVRFPDEPLAGAAPTQLTAAAESRPRMWVASNSINSAAFPGRKSVGFIFHLPQARSEGLDLARRVVAAYRESFVPTEFLSKPTVAMVCAGICAETDTAAADAWPRYARRLYSNLDKSQLPEDLREPPRSYFLGSPGTCRDQIAALADAVSADEMIIHPAAESFQSMLKTYQNLASAFGLLRGPPTPARGPEWHG